MAKASAWLSQRQQIANQLTQVRDTAERLLGELASSGAKFAATAAQQWVLQSVVLREAQRASSRTKGIVIAALLFGAVHLPNPFLAPVTAGAALIWCWLYDSTRAGVQGQ